MAVQEAAPLSIYQRSFVTFLRDCIWTVDEARGGQVRQWPWDDEWEPYWLDIEDTLLRYSPLLIDKTRRTMISNVVCAFDLWIASGGVDPRWPALEFSTDHRRVLIQSQKEKGPGGSAEFVGRVRWLYEEAERRGIRKRWPDFPHWHFTKLSGVATNGGKIDAVAQGADQVRGPGTTYLHAEELSAWEEASVTMATAIPSLHPFGKVCGVTTPAAGTFVADIRNGRLKSGVRDVEMLPTPTGKLPRRRVGDWIVLEIRGARDVPGYDPTQFKGMAHNLYRRDVLGDWTAAAGKAVYDEFLPLHEATERLPYDESQPLICGWDLPASTGGTPCFVPTQLTASGQWFIYPPVCVDDDETIGLEEFGERVANYLRSEFAAPSGLLLQQLKLMHFADPAGNSAPIKTQGMTAKTEQRSAYEIIRQSQGWVMQPGEVSLTKRLQTMRSALLKMLPGGNPYVVVDPEAVVILEGFKGGYHYKQRADGQYELDPLKDRFSHPMDCLSYVASRIFGKGEKKDREDRPLRGQWRAPGRTRT